MLLARVVETSRRTSETSKRNEKTELLATLLRELRPEEIDLGVLFLSGATRQKKTNVGYARLMEARSTPAAEPSLQLLEVDRMLDQIASVKGAGSERVRFGLLRDLLGRATRPEQRFLMGLLTGELRQGALEGIMLEA